MYQIFVELIWKQLIEANYLPCSQKEIFFLQFVISDDKFLLPLRIIIEFAVFCDSYRVND
jgi:hypothetical protein